MVVCIACAAIAPLIIFSQWLGIPLEITTTLIGALMILLSYGFDSWLRDLKEKRYAKKHNITRDEAFKHLLQNYKTGYIPFQTILIMLILLGSSILSYMWMGLI